MMKEERVKILIPYIWDLFKRYLNNTGIIIKSEDVLSSLFMRGEKDVQEFVRLLNKKSKEANCDIHINYQEKLTYKQVILQL